MAERSSLKPAAISAPTLTPQGPLVGKPAIPVARPFTLVGSRNRAHLHLISSSISRNHCSIIVTDNGLYLRDLASRTGVLVNGRKIKETDLRDGDLLQIGSFKFKFNDPAGPNRFPITPKAPAAVLHFTGVNTEIDSRTLTIGRRSNCDIPLEDDSVSNTHAIVFESNGERFIRDLGSRTGTLVNGRPIHHQLLSFGDTIRIGSTEIVYNASDGDGEEPEALSIGMEPIELEPLELEPIEIEADEPVVAPAPVFPRMADTSRAIPLDDDDAQDVANDDAGQPIPVEDTHDNHSENGAIPLELESDDPSTTPAGEAVADEPAEVEPVAGESTELEPIEEFTGDIAPTSFTVVPHEPDSQADSIYAVNVAASEGIFTAAIPIEPGPIAAEAAELIAAAEPTANEPESVTTRDDQPIALDAADHDIATPTFGENDEPEAEPEPTAHPVSDAQDEPEQIAVTSDAEESNFTSPADVEPEAAIESTPEVSATADVGDFTPTLDVLTADAPTAFEDRTTPEDAAIAPPVGQVAEEPAPELSAQVPEEPAAEDAGWTLDVGSVAEPAPITTETAVTSETAPSDDAGASQFTVDAEKLPDETDAVTSSTDEPQHPVRPELPPDVEPASPIAEKPIVIPPVPGPDLIAAAGTAAAAVAATTFKRGRGKIKAEPKPSATPKGGRKKKGTPPTPIVDEPSVAPSAVTPVVEPPTTEIPLPAPSKKRGGSRKKTAPPIVSLAPVEVEPVDTYSVTETPPPTVEDSISLAEPLAEVPAEPEVVSAPESAFPADSISLGNSESQDFAGSFSTPAVESGDVEETSPITETGSEAADAIAEAPAFAEREAAESSPPLEPAHDAAPADSESPTPFEAQTESEPSPRDFEPESTGALAGAAGENPDAGMVPASVEVLEPTDPTPESAQVLEPELQTPTLDDTELDEAMAGLSLTDTAFGRTVVDMGSADSAPLVEDANPTVDEAPEVPSATHHLTASHEQPAPGPETTDVAVSADDALETAGADATAEVSSGEESVEADPATHSTSHAASGTVEPITSEPARDSRDIEFGAAAPTPVDAAYENPASNVGDDFELPEVDLSFDLGGDDEAGLGSRRPEPDPEQTTHLSSSVDETFEPESLSSTDLAPSAPVSPPPAPATQPPAAPAPTKAMDPFFGMNRDLASFLGGVPLTLTSATPIVPAAPGITTSFGGAATNIQSPSVTPPAARKPSGGSPPAGPGAEVVGELEDDIPQIDFSTTDEPLDLFEDSAEKLDEMPDSLAPISDVTNVLSTGAKPAVPPPAPPAPAPMAQPPAGVRPAPPQMRGVTPPPPPKSAPLRSFTSNVNVAPPPMVPGPGTPVSFGGAPGAAGLTAPFGPVGTPQTRQVDVFSHTAFPPLDPSVFSAPQRPASPRAVTQGAAAQRQQLDAEADETSTADDVLGIELDSLPELNTTPVRRTAIPPNQQNPVARPPVAPAKKPWWKSLKILLPLVIAAIIVVILVVMFLQPKHTVQGTLEIQGLDPQNQTARRAQAAKFRELIQNPHVRDVAIENLKEKGLAPGFLNDPPAVAALADANNSPFESSDPDHISLKLNHPTTDTRGDKDRMTALLLAIHAESGAMNDNAAKARQQQADARSLRDDQDKARKAQEQIVEGIKNQLIVSAGPSAANWLLDPQTAVTQVQIEEGDARQAADGAAADVQKKRQALQNAQATAAPTDANVAAESQRVKKAIADLNVRLDAVRLAQAGHANDSANVFGTALDALGHALNDAAPGTLAPAPVTEARAALNEIRELDGSLATRTRDDAKSVAQLRRQIADQRESHLRQIWTGDSSLQAMVEERNAQSHRYGAAIDSNYVDEATKIKGVLEDLDHKIEARRSELATGSQLTDPLQQTLQQTIDRTEAARQAGETQIAQKLQALAATFGPGGPAASLSAASKLSHAASDALVARQAYAAASSLSATSADVEARKLQLQIAEQQARLDSLQQEPGNGGPVELARHALDAAQAAEAKATNAFTKTHNNLVLLTQLVPERAKLDALTDSLKLSQATVSDSSPSPKLIAPGNDAVNVIYARDQRFIYLIGGLAAVLLVFAGPLWMTIHDMSRERHTEAATFTPIHDPDVSTLISSDSDSLFGPDHAHA